jgi:hypothetical protein
MLASAVEYSASCCRALCYQRELLLALPWHFRLVQEVQKMQAGCRARATQMHLLLTAVSATCYQMQNDGLQDAGMPK